MAEREVVDIGTRTGALAEEFEEMASQLIRKARELNDREWVHPCEEEGRNVGQVIGHMTDVFRVMNDKLSRLIAGEQIQRLNSEWIDARNAESAERNSKRSQQEMIDELRLAAAELAEFLRTVTDAQLDVNDVFYEGFDAWTIEETVRFVVIAHGQAHLADVEKSLGTRDSQEFPVPR